MIAVSFRRSPPKVLAIFPSICNSFGKSKSSSLVRGFALLTNFTTFVVLGSLAKAISLSFLLMTAFSSKES